MVTYFSIKVKELLEERRFKKKFPDPLFREIDRSLRFSYLGRNPYTITKRYLKRLGEEDVYQYGETPLLTMHRIAKSAQIQPTDHVFDLGCGRGRACLFLHHFYRCKVTGVDWIEEFVEKGNRVAQKYKMGVDFQRSNFMDIDFSEADVIYLYGTCLLDGQIRSLCEKIKKGTKVISVSYPLSDYSQKFTCTRRLLASYPWGKTEVYINE